MAHHRPVIPLRGLLWKNGEKTDSSLTLELDEDSFRFNWGTERASGEFTVRRPELEAVVSPSCPHCNRILSVLVNSDACGDLSLCRPSGTEARQGHCRHCAAGLIFCLSRPLDISGHYLRGTDDVAVAFPSQPGSRDMFMDTLRRWKFKPGIPGHYERRIGSVAFPEFFQKVTHGIHNSDGDRKRRCVVVSSKTDDASPSQPSRYKEHIRKSTTPANVGARNALGTSALRVSAANYGSSHPGSPRPTDESKSPSLVPPGRKSEQLCLNTRSRFLVSRSSSCSTSKGDWSADARSSIAGEAASTMPRASPHTSASQLPDSKSSGSRDESRSSSVSAQHRVPRRRNFVRALESIHRSRDKYYKRPCDSPPVPSSERWHSFCRDNQVDVTDLHLSGEDLDAQIFAKVPADEDVLGEVSVSGPSQISPGEDDCTVKVIVDEDTRRLCPLEAHAASVVPEEVGDESVNRIVISDSHENQNGVDETGAVTDARRGTPTVSKFMEFDIIVGQRRRAERPTRKSLNFPSPDDAAAGAAELISDRPRFCTEDESATPTRRIRLSASPRTPVDADELANPLGGAESAEEGVLEVSSHPVSRIVARHPESSAAETKPPCRPSEDACELLSSDDENGSPSSGQGPATCVPGWEIDHISVAPSAIARLDKGGFLDDSLLDFFLRFLHKHVLSPRVQSRNYFFNCFFYSRLCSGETPEERFLGVKSWTKQLGSDGQLQLWEFDRVFIPVNYNTHWWLVVIYHPWKAIKPRGDGREECTKRFSGTAAAVEAQCDRPAIICLDSLKGAKASETVAATIVEYLSAEFRERSAEPQKSTHHVIPLEEWIFVRQAVVPRQRNGFDCGVFLIEYSRFLCLRPELSEDLIRRHLGFGVPHTEPSVFHDQAPQSPLLQQSAPPSDEGNRNASLVQQQHQSRSRNTVTGRWFDQRTISFRRSSLQGMLGHMREHPDWERSPAGVQHLVNLFIAAPPSPSPRGPRLAGSIRPRGSFDRTPSPISRAFSQFSYRDCNGVEPKPLSGFSACRGDAHFGNDHFAFLSRTTEPGRCVTHSTARSPMRSPPTPKSGGWSEASTPESLPLGSIGGCSSSDEERLERYSTADRRRS